MKTQLIFIFFLLIILSCTRQQDQTRPNLYAPKVAIAKGYFVPEDSMAKPKVKPVDKNKVAEIPAGKPTVVHTNTNVHLAGMPKVVLAGKPRICTPGQDTFILPKTVATLDSFFAAGYTRNRNCKRCLQQDQNLKL